MTKRVLLTGASGFVGSHVLKLILETTDWEVVCPSTFRHMGMQDRIAFAVGGNKEYLSRVRVLFCDLSSPISKVTSELFGPIDYVLNIASDSHVDRSIKKPSETILNNVGLICSLLDWSRDANLEKFIQVSTDEVYGPAKSKAHVEWDPHFPSNPYSASKAAQENIAFSYWRTYGIPLAITNTMNIVGETQDPEKFTPLVIKKILNGEELTIHTYDSGKVGFRQWIYVGNKASALLHILGQPIERPDNSNTPGKWNIAGDAEYSNLEWAQIIASILEKPLKYKLEDSSIARPGYDSGYSLDNSKLLESGWTPPHELISAMEGTIRWYVDNPEWLI